MTQDSAASSSSGSTERGASSGVGAAVKIAPEIVGLLPNADRFAGVAVLGVVALFSLAVWLGEVSGPALLWLVAIGAFFVTLLMILGFLGRAASARRAAELEAVTGVSTQDVNLAGAVPIGLRLAGEQSIHQSPVVEVIKGYDQSLQRTVAKKILLDPDRRQDFIDGAREAVRISDFPHFTAIYAANFEVERPYILMQFIPGGTLRHHIEAQGSAKIHAEFARHLVFEVGGAMFRAHQTSVRLGNVKASNILLDENDEPFISPRTSLTFVNSRQLRAALLSHEISLEDIVYTAPELLSPELAKSARGELCDQYALGILTYELLTSTLPPTLPTVVGSQSENARVEATCKLLVDKGMAAYQPLVPIHEIRREIPTRVSEIIAKMTALDPEQRFVRLDHALAALRSVQRTLLLTVRDSYIRCLSSAREPGFMHGFYDRFTADEVVRARFSSLSAQRWTAQRGKLQAAIEACFDFAQVFDPKLEIAEPNSMTRLAHMHGPDGLHISEREYELFVDALVATACGADGSPPYDPECTDPDRRDEIARAWRELLMPVVTYFMR